MSIAPETRQECADSALQCFGTAYIFERRARPIRTKLLILAFLGIAGPAALGAVVATFELKKDALHSAVAVAGVVAIVQFIVSIWSLVAKWDDALAYDLESKSANYRLAGEYEKLWKSSSITPESFAVQFEILETEAKLRTELDQRQHVVDREKRMGMRAGLREYQRPCAGCKVTPLSLDSTDCPICGKF